MLNSAGARVVERVARGTGVAALVTALVIALARVLRSEAPDARAAEWSMVLDATPVDSANAGAALARTLVTRIVDHARSGPPDRWPAVAAHMRGLPNGHVRGVLGAAREAGMPIRWHDSSGVRDFSVHAASVPTPSGATLVSAGAGPIPSQLALRVRDAGGVIDSMPATGRSLRVRATALRGPVVAELLRDGVPMVSAVARVPSATSLRFVRLYAQPGWESKFVTAALEESGWHVEGTLVIAPKARVRVGEPTTLDTTRYSVAIVLDSAVAEPAVLRRFLSQGGGVVIAGEAVRDRSLREGVLHGAQVASLEDDRPPVAGALLTDEPRRGIAAFHLAAGPRGVVLEREGSDAVVVVARHGVGRVAVSGYRETWRWRMEGRDESADAHRVWWSALIGAVAFAPDTNTRANTRSAVWPGDAAPVADLVARLGPPSDERVTAQRRLAGGRLPLWLLYVVATVALLLEWALRRLRGAA